MNRTKIKNYAPRARRGFIQAVTDQAAFFGLTAKKTEPIVEQGDLAIIGGRPFPKAVAGKRRRLEERVKRDGFEPTMEALAYTWFNRLVAIRYMELHGYLDHGYRVLSAKGETIDVSNGGATPSVSSAKSVVQIPEILAHAEHLDLPGLDRDTVIDLKLAGDKEAELYRMLLVAQCNALHTAMPFLFDRIDDETELVLPENLLHSDSLIRKLVGEIDEQDWQEVEIIGWIYQFYISEKKDQVIGKVVKSKDIPAATQLFTPNWIVKYLVQNSLGRQWIATYPDSPLKGQMEYYIEPAEQTPEVQEQLKAITPESLNPEELTLLDPACGSGHILVEAYDLFKAIYQERGYNRREIPRLILEKNLYGLEIDDRATQLASLALMMKARADDGRIFDSGVKPNLVAIQHSEGLKASEIYFAFTSPLGGEPELELKSPAPVGYLFEPDDNLFTRAEADKTSAPHEPTTVNFSQTDLTHLLELFENATTFGSLIQIPPKLAAKMPEIEKRLDDMLKHGDLTHASTHALGPLLQQTRLLANRYDVVVANPPYMGSKFFSPTLKGFVNRIFKNAKSDLYACFIERNASLAKLSGFVGMITIPNWMFLSSFEDVRKLLLHRQTIDTFVHNGRGVFGSDFGSCAFIYRNHPLPQYQGSYRRLFEKQGSVASNNELAARFPKSKTYTSSSAELAVIPGSPIAYWASPPILSSFTHGQRLGSLAPTKVGQNTGDNNRFLRRWHEVKFDKIKFDASSIEDAVQSRMKWFPYNKGGQYRRWFGNCEFLINWENDGEEVKAYAVERNNGKHWSRYLQNLGYVFKEGITWSFVSSSFFGVRFMEKGFIFDVAGSSCFPAGIDTKALLAFLSSSAATSLLAILNPTVNFQAGNIADLPVVERVVKSLPCCREIAEAAIDLARKDWDSFETSWNFKSLPVIQHAASSLKHSQESADADCLYSFSRMKQLEEQNNRLFIEAYDLQDELSPEVPDDQITLYRPDRDEDVRRLISYAVGCMMGRYSLDKPGLIYAHCSNIGFDPSQYQMFPADDDGLLPLLESDWGIPDDAANRLVEFISVSWPQEHLEENLQFIAESLVPTRSEQPRDTIRRYLTTGFFKQHLSMYKRRPIYWLFTSGKLRAFQCLVYLHRYNDGTLSRMRTEYVIPLQGKLAARADHLATEITAATSTSHRKKLEKERDKLIKQQVELRAFDEKLRHYADQRIALDLDDGVKVNYAKFGDLLAEVKAVTGGKE